MKQERLTHSWMTLVPKTRKEQVRVDCCEWILLWKTLPVLAVFASAFEASVARCWRLPVPAVVAACIVDASGSFRHFRRCFCWATTSSTATVADLNTLKLGYLSSQGTSISFMRAIEMRCHAIVRPPVKRMTLNHYPSKCSIAASNNGCQSLITVL